MILMSDHACIAVYYIPLGSSEEIIPNVTCPAYKRVTHHKLYSYSRNIVSSSERILVDKISCTSGNNNLLFA